MSIDEIVGDFSGVVMVRQNGSITFQKGFGMANRADAIANTPNTRFATASGTKTFTAVAICQLVEQGKFDFSTRLQDCLNIDFPNWDASVTIHHLLTHTSGVGDYFDEEIQPDEDFEKLFYETPMYTLERPADMLPWFQDNPMKLAPGERFAYCNAGFIVLGLIIEQHSGMAYTDYIQQHVFDRAGMTDAGCFRMDQLPARTALGYKDDGRTNIYSVPVIPMPDGGAFVTAPDMLRFWDALTSNQLLSPETTQQFLTAHTPAYGNGFYGYGHWITRADNDFVCHRLVGSDPGVEFMSGYFPQQNTVVTVINNQNLESNLFWPIVRTVIPEWPEK